MTVDIAALRETAGTGEQSDWMTWPRIDPVKLKELLDQFEVVSSSEWKLAGELVVAQKQLEAAQARIAELESEQEPVGTMWRLVNKASGMIHPWKCSIGQVEASTGGAIEIEVQPLYTRQPKPVIKLPEPELVYSTATDSYGEEGCLMFAVADVLRILNQHGITVESE